MIHLVPRCSPCGEWELPGSQDPIGWAIGSHEVPTSVIEFSLLENCVRDALQACYILLLQDLEGIEYDRMNMYNVYNVYTFDSFRFYHLLTLGKISIILSSLAPPFSVTSSTLRIRSRFQQRRCAFFALFVFGRPRNPREAQQCRAMPISDALPRSP